LRIVTDRDSTQLDVVVHRMRVCHDLALSPDNRGKIEVGYICHRFVSPQRARPD
jgi:hypothetical protein